MNSMRPEALPTPCGTVPPSNLRLKKKVKSNAALSWSGCAQTLLSCRMLDSGSPQAGSMVLSVAQQALKNIWSIQILLNSSFRLMVACNSRIYQPEIQVWIKTMSKSAAKSLFPSQNVPECGAPLTPPVALSTCSRR